MERKMKKSFLVISEAFLIFCFVFFAGIFLQKGNCVVQAADSITREEWIHILADTFQMKIEDGLVPDDYYQDISESTSIYYNDIMTAVNFGVIDLEAGEEFYPKKSVTSNLKFWEGKGAESRKREESKDYRHGNRRERKKKTVTIKIK